MKDIEHIFDDIKLEVYKQDSDCLFDPVRAILVNATPEEYVRQKMIVFMQDSLEVPLNRIQVEESMGHTKKGERTRADIVVYCDDECEEPLMVVECKANWVDVRCDDVFVQAVGYQKILNTEYIMLVNGSTVIIYKYKDGSYLEVDGIPTYQSLLNSEISIIEETPVEAFSYEELMSKDFQAELTDEAYIGEDTQEYIKGFLANLWNLILLKPITDAEILKKLGVLEDCYIGMPHFGNSGGGNYQEWSRLFIAKDHSGKDQVLGISICGTAHTENDPHWGNRLGRTQLNVSITNKEKRHHSLQLTMDRFCNYNSKSQIVEITHNGALTNGNRGAVKHHDVINYIQERDTELVQGNKIYLGKLDNSKLLDWNQREVQVFIRNLLRYAVLRDGLRAERNQ